MKGFLRFNAITMGGGDVGKILLLLRFMMLTCNEKEKMEIKD